MLLQPYGKWNGKTVALCDGHGMETPGKRSPNGMRENEFNRAVVAYLCEHLRRCGFRVLLVAPTDKDTPLEERVALANKYNVDFYLSVHANALAGEWGNHGGIETFADFRFPKTVSEAKIIHAEVMKGTKFKDRGVKDGRHLYVCNSTNMSAVLVELGFMDSLYDSPLLKKESYRKECAEELARGVCKIFKVNYVSEKKDPIPTEPKKEEPFMFEKAIVINSEADVPAARRLARATGAVIVERVIAEEKQVAKELFIVGGEKGMLKADEFVILSGKDFFETVANVKTYLKN